MQDQLQAALRKFTQRECIVTCAGRTDTGVHAIEQIVHFDTELERETFSWVRGVNAFLPASISVRWASTVKPLQRDDASEQFHARFSATARTYHYVLYNHPVRAPLLAGRAGWVFRPLDAQSMRLAAAYLLGEHDFSAFRAAECQARSPVRSMHALEVRQYGNIIVFTLRANAFLHHMVRNIVGSLILVGNGNRPAEWIGELLAGKDRSQAAPTFMPDGLYLAKIDYDSRWALPQEDSWSLPGMAEIRFSD